MMLSRSVICTGRFCTPMADVGLKKSITACKKLQEQNPGIQLVPIHEKITSKNVMEMIEAYDVVVDCTDNFETKYLLTMPVFYPIK